MIMNLKSIFLLVFLMSCESQSGSGTFIIHPNEDNLIDENQIVNIITNQIESEILYEKLVSIFININETLFEIGKLDGVTEEIFSNIDQVVINHDKIYILDRNNVRISVFSLISGDFLGIIGNKGKGPGEFSQPNSIAFTNDKIFISDRIFSIKSGRIISGKIDQLEEFEIDLKTPPEQICAMDKFLIVKSTTSNDTIPKALHKFYIENPNEKYSFGEPYITDDVILQEVLSEGIIACDTDSNNVILAKYSLPYIYNYNANGTLNWVSKINDYKPLKFREEVGRGVSTRWDKTDFVYDEYSSIFQYNNYLVLQIKSYHNFFRGDQLEIQKNGIDTYLIDSNSGKGAYLGKDAPEIKFMNDKFIVTDGGKNYPSIKVFKL